MGSGLNRNSKCKEELIEGWELLCEGCLIPEVYTRKVIFSIGGPPRSVLCLPLDVPKPDGSEKTALHMRFRKWQKPETGL